MVKVEGALPLTGQREPNVMYKVETRPHLLFPLILALSYGGRLEIIDGIKSLLRAIELGHIDKAMIDVEMFSKHLYTRYYPDPDLIIRTSGEMRLSNFLLWQLSYSEMYVTPKLWPDFTKKDLFAAVEEFGRRQRRYGGSAE